MSWVGFLDEGWDAEPGDPVDGVVWRAVFDPESAAARGHASLLWVEPFAMPPFEFHYIGVDHRGDMVSEWHRPVELLPKIRVGRYAVVHREPFDL